METRTLRKVETIRKSLKRRRREDGGEGSGNWGHVGVPGHKGGSAPGGGRGFRMLKTVSKQYTSQAKVRKEMKEAHSLAMQMRSPKALARAQKRMGKVNMNVKSANAKNAGKKGYQVVRQIDEHASANILKDVKGRGKRARESSVSKISGTRAAIQYAFPNRTTRGGNKSRGGKTAERRSKV